MIPLARFPFRGVVLYVTAEWEPVSPIVFHMYQLYPPLLNLLSIDDSVWVRRERDSERVHPWQMAPAKLGSAAWQMAPSVRRFSQT